MALDHSSEDRPILRKAREQERKYGWLYAAWSYEHALRSNSGTAPLADETWQRIGFCYERASRQAEDVEEFRKLRKLAGEAYKKAARLLEKKGNLKDQGKSAQCNAIATYTHSWLAPTPTEKEKMLDECRTFGKKALEAFKKAGDELNYGKSCNDLLLCLFEGLHIVSSEKQKRIIAQEGICYSNEAISVLSKLDNKEELVRAYSLASLQSWYAANISEQEEKRKELAHRSLEYSEKAVALSKDMDDPYSIALSRWSAALSTLFFSEKIECSLEHANEMLQQGTIVSDSYLKGVASYVLAFITDWMVPRESNPDRKKERCEEVIKYAEDGIRYLQLVSQDSIIADTYLFYAQSYSSLASDFAANSSEKLALSTRAVEIGRKGLEHAVRSGSPDSMGSTFHALSKALHSHSRLVRRNDERTKLLEEALSYRKEYLEIVEKTFPSNNWIFGVGKTYAAQIKAELARQETDAHAKTILLKDAVSDMENGISCCEKWISSRPSPSLIVTVAGYEDWLGRVLDELHLLTEDEKILRRACVVYSDAAKKFRKADLPSLVAESYWKIARDQDQMREHQEAARSFHKAFKEYKGTAQRMPPFSDFFMDYALYMRAWAEIEKAKFAHDGREYSAAAKHYRKTARLLKQTKAWSYLSSNFLAWSLLERAEDLSRKERGSQSIRAFNKATELFREARSSLQVASNQIDNADEKYLVERLIEVSDTRGEYCFGRVAIEEARILDRRGEHVAGSEKYGSAAEVFRSIVEDASERTRRELQSIICLCRAWQKMLMAEAKTSSGMYGEAAELFEKAKEHTLDESTSLLALAHGSFCKALEAGTEFEMTRDTEAYSVARKYMEVAANCYLKSGFETAAEYAKGTQRLFDAYFYVETAKMETNPEKKARYYMMAEKVLQFSAGSYVKAMHPEKTKQVQQLLERIREEKELALMLNDILHAPTIVSSTASFVTPTPGEEMAVGVESFEGANIQGTLVTEINQVRAGEDINLEMHIVNVGKEAILLARVDEIVPTGFELVSKPDYCQIENSHLRLRGKRLDPLKTEEIKLILRSHSKGSFVVTPRIAYMDAIGLQRFHEPEPVTIEVSEVTVSTRIPTGYTDLDKLLFGGIPESYPVILTSPFCDERDLLISKFVKVGIDKDEVTFYITLDAGEVRTLADEYQPNLYVFICSPHADRTIKDSPNVFKLKGVENLSQISITLAKAFRGLGEPQGSKRRACIEIVSDILLQHRAVQTRRWLAELVSDLRSRGFTTLAVMNPLMHPPQDVQAILGLFEGEINIYAKESRRGLQKFVRVKRMYNQKYLESELLLRKEKLGMTIEVPEASLLSRVATGYVDLDKLLFGGIPENYSVILTSPFCDERDLLIKGFLEEGTKEDMLAFYVTMEASGVETLAEEFQSNFYLFICNPRADMMIKNLPNVFKLGGVVNLTDISIALINAFRRLDESPSGPRRICIELVSDVLLQHQAVTTRRWLTELISNLRSRGFTTLAVMNPLMHPPQDVQAILGLFEGEINIYAKESRRGLQKFVRVKRMYNQKYLESELLLAKEKLEIP